MYIYIYHMVIYIYLCGLLDAMTIWSTPCCIGCAKLNLWWTWNSLINYIYIYFANLQQFMCSPFLLWKPTVSFFGWHIFWSRFVYIYIYTHVYMYVNIYIYNYIYTILHGIYMFYVCVYTYIVCIYIYIYIYTLVGDRHIYIYI